MLFSNCLYIFGLLNLQYYIYNVVRNPIRVYKLFKKAKKKKIWVYTHAVLMNHTHKMDQFINYLWQYSVYFQPYNNISYMHAPEMLVNIHSNRIKLKFEASLQITASAAGHMIIDSLLLQFKYCKIHF